MGPARPFRVLALDEMVARIISKLETKKSSAAPCYAMILGAGFSYPIIPMAREMLTDIPWWLYCQQADIDYVDESPQADDDDWKEFQKTLWAGIQNDIGRHGDDSLALSEKGVPETAQADNAVRAYQALMSSACALGLCDPEMRRKYLKAVISKAGHRINGSHLYLAAILAKQEDWEGKAPLCRTFITTNFDPLLQRALQFAGKLYFMSDRPTRIDPPDDDDTDAIHVVYTHGSVHRYDLRNTGDEIDEARKQNAQKLQPYFERHGVIVIGYGGWRDATMDALKGCFRFDGNLYWCDVHPPDSAETRLAPHVLDFLKEKKDCAFYVHIPSADKMMRLFHEKLGLGPAPEFIIDPLAAIGGRLDGVRDSVVLASADEEEIPKDAFAKIIDNVCDKLALAQRVFNNPEEMMDTDADAKEHLREAEISNYSLLGILALMAHNYEEAIGQWTRVLDYKGVSETAKAGALWNRAQARRASGDLPGAIEDYTAVVDMPDAPADQRAGALLARALAKRDIDERKGTIEDCTAVIEMRGVQQGHTTEALLSRAVARAETKDHEGAIEDFTTVLEMRDAPMEQKARALFGRALARAETEDQQGAIEDFTTLLRTFDVPTERKARALLVRGVAKDSTHDGEGAIEDFTAVVDMPDVPADLKATALFNRGVIKATKGEYKGSVEDYAVLVKTPNAPSDLKAKALVNSAVAKGKTDDYEGAINDCTAVMRMSDVPSEQKAKALVNRGVAKAKMADHDGAMKDFERVLGMTGCATETRACALLSRGWELYEQLDNVDGMVEDSRAALELESPYPVAEMNLALGLMLKGEKAEALKQYKNAASSCDAENELRAAIRDIEDALEKRESVEGAREAIDTLQKRLKEIEGSANG